MRVFAGLVLVVAAAIALLTVIGTLPWWDAAFPLLIAWLCGTSLVMQQLGKRAR